MNAEVSPGPAVGGPGTAGPLCGELLQLCRGAGLRLGPGAARAGVQAVSEQLAGRGCRHGPDGDDCVTRAAQRLAVVLELGSDDVERRVLAGLRQGLRALEIHGCHGPGPQPG
ncbi:MULTISPECIES: hypothetical protein [unclassified Streptomyces]|uniref:hypothetical protein n=1 Tax=unclassified Streptomyces TaxID=2593676 RepID=UPI0037FB96FE